MLSGCPVAEAAGLSAETNGADDTCGFGDFSLLQPPSPIRKNRARIYREVPFIRVQFNILCYPIAMGDGTFRKGKRRGMALATSLMLSVLILVLGMSLLTTSQHDLAFQRQQRARDRAELLARSGMEHVDYLLAQDPSQFNTVNVPLNTTPKKYHVVQDVEYFTLSQQEETPGGRRVLLVEGVVESSNPETAATRTIAVPFGFKSEPLRSEIATNAFHK